LFYQKPKKMKKVKKIMAVCAFCLTSSFVMNTSAESASKVYAACSTGARGWKQTVAIASAEIATNIGIYYMLLGTGAPGIAGVVCGCAATM
jgi:hypothetical protein